MLCATIWSVWWRVLILCWSFLSEFYFVFLQHVLFIFFSMYGGIHVIPGFFLQIHQKHLRSTRWSQTTWRLTNGLSRKQVTSLIPVWLCTCVYNNSLRWPAFVLFQPKVFKQLVNKSYFFHPINNWDYPPDYPVLHSSLSRPDQVEIVTADFDRHLCKGKHNNRVGFCFLGGVFCGVGGGTLVFWPLSSKAQIIIGKIRWGKKILKRKNNFRF